MVRGDAAIPSGAAVAICLSETESLWNDLLLPSCLHAHLSSSTEIRFPSDMGKEDEMLTNAAEAYRGQIGQIVYEELPGHPDALRNVHITHAMQQLNGRVNTPHARCVTQETRLQIMCCVVPGC